MADYIEKERLKNWLDYKCEFYKYDNINVLVGLYIAETIVDKLPLSDVISKEDIKKVIEEIESEHPYKILGEYETYSDYHQGWSDACDRILCSLLYKEDLEDK